MGIAEGMHLAQLLAQVRLSGRVKQEASNHQQHKAMLLKVNNNAALRALSLSPLPRPCASARTLHAMAGN